jgi:hypothetical protein
LAFGNGDAMDIREVRRTQTLRDAQRLTDDVASWVQWRKDRDIDANGYLGRYDTQLDTIASEVQAAAERVRAIASGDATNRPTGEVFRDYNLHDQRLIWVRYAWEFFRQKLDQRDHEALKATLEAADEVSWGCYSIFFRSAGLSVPPAPIPYIEHDYVPSALRPGQAHVLTRKPGADAGPLKEYFETLPTPLLRLPPSVVTAPWSLTLICHEIGHLLQGHVEPSFGFYSTFSAMVADAVAQAGGAADEQARWAGWSQEIFADLCMAVTTGPWSAWALMPWVITTDDRMGEPLDKYPAPLVRLRLLDRMSKSVALPEATDVFALMNLEIGESALADAVAQLASRVITINKRQRTWSQLLTSSPAVFEGSGRTVTWSSRLLGTGDLLPENDKTSARDAVVAAARAHFTAVKTGGDLEALQPRVLTLIRACHDNGVRATPSAVAPVRTLSDSLFNLRDEELLM